MSLQIPITIIGYVSRSSHFPNNGLNIVKIWANEALKGTLLAGFDSLEGLVILDWLDAVTDLADMKNLDLTLDSFRTLVTTEKFDGHLEKKQGISS